MTAAQGPEPTPLSDAEAQRLFEMLVSNPTPPRRRDGRKHHHRQDGRPTVTETIFAQTYGGDEVRLTLSPEDAEEFHDLPRLPREIPEDFEPPSVIVTDVGTGRTYWLARDFCGLRCGCAAYAEDITEDWAKFEAEEEPETIDAYTSGGGEVQLTLAPEDVAEFDALPRLPQELPDDFEPPSIIVTDIVTGRTYWMARAFCGLHCDCRAYVEDITEDWAEFVAREEAGDADAQT